MQARAKRATTWKCDANDFFSWSNHHWRWFGQAGSKYTTGIRIFLSTGKRYFTTLHGRNSNANSTRLARTKIPSG